MATALDSLSASEIRESSIPRMLDPFRTPGRRMVPPPKLDCIVENVSGSSSPDRSSERSTRPSALFDSLRNAPNSPLSKTQHVLSSPATAFLPGAGEGKAIVAATQPAAEPGGKATSKANALKGPKGPKGSKGKRKKKETAGTKLPARALRPVKTSGVRRVPSKRSPSVLPPRRPRVRQTVRLPIKKGPSPPPRKAVLASAGIRDRERDTRGWDPEMRNIHLQNLVERLAMPKMAHSERVSMSIHPGSNPMDLLRTEEEKAIWARWHPQKEAAAKPKGEENVKKKNKKGKKKGKTDDDLVEFSETDSEMIAEEKAAAKRASRVPSHRVVRRKKRAKGRGGRRSRGPPSRDTEEPPQGDAEGAPSDADKEGKDTADSKKATPRAESPPVPPKAALHLARITTRQRSKRAHHPAAGRLVRPPGVATRKAKNSSPEVKVKRSGAASAPPNFRPASKISGVASDKSSDDSAMGDEVTEIDKLGRAERTTLIAAALMESTMNNKRAATASTAPGRQRKLSGKARPGVRRGTVAGRSSVTERPGVASARVGSGVSTRLRLRRALAKMAAETRSPTRSRVMEAVREATGGAGSGVGAGVGSLASGMSSVGGTRVRSSSMNKSPGRSAANPGAQNPRPGSPRRAKGVVRSGPGLRKGSAGKKSSSAPAKRTGVAPAVAITPAAPTITSLMGAPTQTNASASRKSAVSFEKKMTLDEVSASGSQGKSRWPEPESLPNELVDALGPSWTNAAEAYLRRRGMPRDERASFRAAHRVSGASRTLRRLNAGLSSGMAGGGVPGSGVGAVTARGSVENTPFGIVALPAVLHPALGQPLPSSRRALPVVPKPHHPGRVRFAVTQGPPAVPTSAADKQRSISARPDSAVSRHMAMGLYPSAPPPTPKAANEQGPTDIKTIKAPRPEQYMTNVSSDDDSAGPTEPQRIPPPPTLPRLAALFAATGGSQNNAVRRLVMGGRAAKTRPFLQTWEGKRRQASNEKPTASVTDRHILARTRTVGATPALRA